jgi:hypothetical protein
METAKIKKIIGPLLILLLFSGGCRRVISSKLLTDEVKKFAEKYVCLLKYGETGETENLPHTEIQTGTTEKDILKVKPGEPPVLPSLTTMCAIVMLIFFLFIFLIASMWQVYTKVGEPGWAVLVPVYNSYVLARIGGKPGWLGIVACLAGFIPIAGPIIVVVLGLIIAIGVVKTFGKGGLFGLGLAFLPFIFYPILGFGSSEVTGMEPKERDYPGSGLRTSGQQFFTPAPATTTELHPIPMPEEPEAQKVPQQHKLDIGAAGQQKTEKDCIHFTCSCGKRFKVPMGFAGKMGVCPQCKTRVRIPDK